MTSTEFDSTTSTTDTSGEKTVTLTLNATDLSNVMTCIETCKMLSQDTGMEDIAEGCSELLANISRQTVPQATAHLRANGYSDLVDSLGEFLGYNLDTAQPNGPVGPGTLFKANIADKLANQATSDDEFALLLAEVRNGDVEKVASLLDATFPPTGDEG